MIKHLIFDFGDVFINLDKAATLRLLTSEITDFQITEEMTHINADYEKGLLTTSGICLLLR